MSVECGELLVQGRRYRLLRALDDLAGWSTVHVHEAGTAGPFSHTDSTVPSQATQVLYRVSIELLE